MNLNAFCAKQLPSFSCDTSLFRTQCLCRTVNLGIMDIVPPWSTNMLLFAWYSQRQFVW